MKTNSEIPDDCNLIKHSFWGENQTEVKIADTGNREAPDAVW